MKFYFLNTGLRHTGGRNNQGKITSYRKGGGHKQRYKYISSFLFFLNVNHRYIVLKTFYNLNNKAKVSLINYKYDNFFNPHLFNYMPAIKGIKYGINLSSTDIGI